MKIFSTYGIEQAIRSYQILLNQYQYMDQQAIEKYTFLSKKNGT